MVERTPRYSIRVVAESRYVPERSQPELERYFFAYTITIANTGSVPARLLSRHWVITNARGQIQEVRGEGVVGEQPHLLPGDVFEYTSAAIIETRIGTMHGTYRMQADDGVLFDADISPFRLMVPDAPLH